MGWSSAPNSLISRIDTFLDAQVVELDALALGALLAEPVARFKPVFGARRLGAKQPVVPVEAVHHGLGDRIGQGRIEALGEHGVSRC